MRLVVVAALFLSSVALGDVLSGQSQNAEEVSPKDQLPSVSAIVSPVDWLAKIINAEVQIPVSSRWSLGPKVTLFGNTKTVDSKTSAIYFPYEAGLRGVAMLNHDLSESGFFVSSGLFRVDYTFIDQRSSKDAWGGYAYTARGWMLEGSFGYKQRFAMPKVVFLNLQIGGQYLSSTSKDAPFLFMDGKTSGVMPVAEFGIGLDL